MSTSSPRTVWYSRDPAPSALALALHLGDLDEELGRAGVELRSIRHDPRPIARRAHLTHVGEGVRHGGNVAALHARASGADTVLLGLTWTNELQAVLASRDSEIVRPVDLTGRRLGVPERRATPVDVPAIAARHGFASALALAELRLDKHARVVPLRVDRTFEDEVAPGVSSKGSLFGARELREQYGAEARALLRGDVDAIFVRGAAGLELAYVLDVRMVAELGRHARRRARVNDGTPSALTVSGSLLRTRPDVVESLLYHLLRAARWARENVADARRVLAAEVGAAEELVDAAYGPDWWTSLELELSDAALEGLVRQKALLREHGYLPADVDLAAFVDPRPLAAARARLARESASATPAFEWQESRDASWSRADPTAAVAARR